MSKLGRVIELIDEGRLSPERIAVENDCPKRYVDYVKRHINLHRNNAAKSASVWSKPRVELLKRCWAEGMSASQTACRLGGFQHCQDGGRSAVIGKVHRLGLSGRQVRVRKTIARPRPKRVNRYPQHFRKSKWATFAENLTEEPMPTEDNSIATKRWSELNDKDCRWIIGDPKGRVISNDKMFCGKKKVPGLSWCPEHCARAFNPAPLKRLQYSSPVPSEKETV